MDLTEPVLEIKGWDELPQATRELWQGKLANVNLPPLVSELLAARLDSETFDPRDMAVLASRDPVLGAKLLAVANSARFGLTTPMTSIQRSVVHLGFNLVRTIMVAYSLESTFGRMASIDRNHLNQVRWWSSGASVLAFHWAQAADLPDPSTAATAALLGLLGTLVLGLAQPSPGAAYFDLPDGVSRLQYESSAWQVTSPLLGCLLATNWGLPAPLPTFISRQWEPLCRPLAVHYETRPLVLIGAAVTLIGHVLADHDVSVGQVLDRQEYRVLKSNLADNRLLDELLSVWSRPRFRRELLAAMSE
jgi:HD-like signal output (HDOD) protein